MRWATASTTAPMTDRPDGSPATSIRTPGTRSWSGPRTTPTPRGSSSLRATRTASRRCGSGGTTRSTATSSPEKGTPWRGPSDARGAKDGAAAVTWLDVCGQRRGGQGLQPLGDLLGGRGPLPHRRQVGPHERGLLGGKAGGDGRLGAHDLADGQQRLAVRQLALVQC